MNTPEPCPRIEALSALIDGELGDTDRAAVRAHADRCPVCAPVLAQFEQLHARFAALDPATPAFDLAPAIDRRIEAAIGGERGGPPRRTRPVATRWWQLALLAPGGAAAVSIGLWLGAALPAAAPGVPATAAQMAPFSTVPAGALCPVPQACRGPLR